MFKPCPQICAFPIIGHQYCRPKYISLNVYRPLFVHDGKFIVTDSDGNAIFNVDAALLTLHNRHVIRDAAGHPIVTLHNKIRTLHDRWEVFRGDSTRSKNLLFSVKRMSMRQGRIQLAVFLATNTSERAWDFMVDVDLFTQSCAVEARLPSITLATMENRCGNKVVTVYPYVDYAFIAALLVILDKMND